MVGRKGSRRRARRFVGPGRDLVIWARVSLAGGFVLGDLAKPVDPVSVSFAPSKAPADWSVSVTIEDVGRTEAPRARNDGRSFREGGR